MLKFIAITSCLLEGWGKTSWLTLSLLICSCFLGAVTENTLFLSGTSGLTKCVEQGMVILL